MREVAVGVLVRNGLVLACQRKATARYPLKWEFPGGKLEQGETAREALYRELHEELAIRVVRAEVFHTQDWTYPDSATATSDGAFRVHYFTVTAFDGEPVNRAFERMRWVSLSELAGLDILDGNREAVALLSRSINVKPSSP